MILNVPVVTLSARDNKKLSNSYQDLKYQIIGMNLKQKVKINAANE